MSQLAIQVIAEAAPAFRFERSNIVRLAIAQALAGANSTVIYATGAVVGDMIGALDQPVQRLRPWTEVKRD